MIPGCNHPLLMAGGGDPLDELGVIARSLRFRAPASPRLACVLPASANNKLMAISCWVKRAAFNGNYRFFGATNGATNAYLGFGNGGSGDGVLVTFDSVTTANGELLFPAQERDPGSHSHLWIGIDTTQAVASDRVKVKINGVLQSSPSGAYPALNAVPIIGGARNHFIGAQSDTAGNPASFFEGMLSHFAVVIGQVPDATAFAQTHPATGQWRPKSKATVRTIVDAGGAGSFFLPFDDPTNTTTLCADASAKGNNWTATNISLTAGVTNDSLLDAPTANYSTLNSLVSATYKPTYSNGNLTVTPASAQYNNAFATMAVSSGKWFAQIKFNGTCNSADCFHVSGPVALNGCQANTGVTPGNYADGYQVNLIGGNKTNNGSSSAYGSAFAAGDVGMIALDMDAGKVWFGKNGTWFNSGDPVAGTNPAYSGLSGSFVIGTTVYTGGCSSHDVLFGANYAPYASPSGFKSFCTKNLNFPAVPNASKAFAVVTDSGANVQATLAAARAGWANYIEIFKRRDPGTNEGWRWRFSDDLANYLDTSGTAAKAAFPALGGTSYIGYALKVSAQNGVATGTFVHVNGVADTIPDNLGNSRKAVILRRESAGGGDWLFYHPDLTAGKLLYLNKSDAETVDASISSVTANSFVAAAALPAGTYRWIALADTASFLKLVKHTGNASADGPFDAAGLSPSLLLSKRTDAAGNHEIMDVVRDSSNVATKRLYLDLNSGEDTGGGVDMDANGVKVRTNLDSQINASGAIYVLLLIAAFPFRYANAR